MNAFKTSLFIPVFQKVWTCCQKGARLITRILPIPEVTSARLKQLIKMFELDYQL